MALRFAQVPSVATSSAHLLQRSLTSFSCAAPHGLRHKAPTTLCTASRHPPPSSLSQPDAADSQPPTYTSMHSNPLVFWNAHPGIHPPQLEQAPRPEDTPMLLAELLLLANAASDRAHMHSILAQQRDNWNTLFQHTLTAATLTACVMAGLNGQHPSLSLSLPALLLNAGCAFMMSIINQFQPSQLAEEQRTASRLYKKLVSDIDYALQVPAYLRQPTPALLKDSQHRLHALGRAYPMPLTPGGLEKFPSQVVPPILSERSTATASAPDHSCPTQMNGWTEPITRDLKEVATLLHDSDIKTYTSWAQNVVKVNKCLAIAAPTFAIVGAALNAASALGGSSYVSLYAAMCSVLASFAGSFSHDMQAGMVMELYRNSAGYYAELEASIGKTLRVPVEERENGVLFRRRVAYELGREGEDGVPLLPTGAKAGGTLF